MLQNNCSNKYKKKLRDEQASLVLDTALIIPLIILICYFMLSATLTIQHEIVMRYALDQTAKELSLLIPLAEGIYSELEHSTIDEVIDKVIPEGNTEFRQSAGDLASSIFLQNYLQSQVDKWLDDGANKLKIKLPTDERQIILNTRSDHSIQIKINYHVKTPWSKTEKQAITYIPVWTKYDNNYQEILNDEIKSSELEDNIWSEHNFVRGRYFREKYNANLPFNYPIICRYEQGEVLAVRSLDLTAPTYGTDEQITLQVNQEINNLMNFQGSERETGLTLSKIESADINSRKLIIVLPGNSDYDLSSSIFTDLLDTATSSGIDLQFSVVGNSYRYREKFENTDSEVKP